MKQNRAAIFLGLAVIVGGFGAAFFLNNFLAKAKPELPESYADEDLALQGAKLKGYVFGAEGLLADWYWMQSLQYLGGKISASTKDVNLEDLRPLNPRLLYPYLDNATDLDPHFLAAYSYGAVVLPAIDPQQAIEIAAKGIANNPDQFRLYQHLGYIYWRLGNYEKATESYEKGAMVEGAPPFMELMAAKMKSDGGSRDMAREIYRQMANEAADSQTRESAELRLLELDSLDERDALRSALTAFKTRNNRCAENWQEILPLLQNVKLLSGADFHLDNTGNIFDPSGAPYFLDRQNCEVKLSENSQIPAR